MHHADFVENLIARQQYVEAVRFSCAYNLGDNNQLVALLREHVQNAKLISESSCNEADSFEIKVFFLFYSISILRNIPSSYHFMIVINIL